MITFVILNYKNTKDTIDCLKSIKKIKTNKKIKTIVVDNNSDLPKELEKIKPFCDKLIELSENVGFAKGNNVGCKVAIDTYHPDFLAVINNDTLIEQINFVDLVYRIYEETNFDALGPAIITNGGQSVNPFKAYENLDEITTEIRKSKKLIKIYKSILLRNLLKLYLKVKYILVKPQMRINGQKRELGVSLHGCAIIFSKKYYQRYDDIFYNKTFMYHEEEFLTYRKKKDKLIFVYDPMIQIFHKEGASLSKYINNNYEKLIFREKNRIKSLMELERIIRENKKI